MRLVWLAGIIAAWAVPATARACQCAGERPAVARSFAEAGLVAVGTVDEHRFVADRGFVTTITLSRVFKGDAAKTIELAAAKTCAVGFEPRTRWLVYAYADGDGGWTTTYCTRTAKIADATDDLRFLDPRRASFITLPIVWSHDPFAQLLRLAALTMLAAR